MSRNVLLVTLDSLRADHCGFMGYNRDTTPTIDRMAEKGMTFENAVAAGVPTIASMTSVMTGEHSVASPEIGRTDEQRHAVTSRPKIAEVLSNAGYSTGACSPNPPASSYFGFDEGFDWFEDFLHKDRGFVERTWNRIFRRSIQGGKGATYLRLLRNVVKREEVLRPWEDYYDEILEWRSRIDEPYFLWVLLLEPHHPWLPPREDRQFSSRWDTYRSFEHYWRMLNTGWKPDFTDRERQRLINLYDDSIRSGDRFLARLERDFRDDDPVFIVHADHGEEFGTHGRYGHQPYLSESLIHVPLVITNGGMQGSVLSPVSLRSIAPTIAELTGVSHPFTVDSLLADERDKAWALSKVSSSGGRRMAVRTQEFRYGVNGGKRTLHDLRTDSEEERNVIKRHPGLTEIFDDIVDGHLRTEREKRAIRNAVSEQLASRGV